MKATRKQKAELREGYDESRVSYETEMQEHVKRFEALRESYQAHRLTVDAAFQMAGQMAEAATAIGIAASDLDDDGLAKAAAAVQKAAASLGHVLTQRRNAYYGGAL